MPPRPLAELSLELRDLLVRAAGYLDANFVHAYTAAFHRLPRLYQQLGEDFARSDEVREVTSALLGLLDARRASPGADDASRESRLAGQIRTVLSELDQSGTDRDVR